MAWFKRPKDRDVLRARRKSLPDGLWLKCKECGEILFKKRLIENKLVCLKCGYHFTMGAWERIELLVDKGTFKEYDKNLESVDALAFKGSKSYKDKLASDRKKTGLKDAIISGIGLIEDLEVSLCVTDSNFIMGSMGVVVGEKIARAAERAIKKKIPLIIVSGSGGGARMYEGIYSLMQMAKTSAAIAKMNEAGQLYISVLTNPTMAGIMASFASLGDVMVAEPNALIGFTGPRVIEQTIRQQLPEGFQTSEFLLKHGFLDMIVARKNMKSELARIIKTFNYKKKIKKQSKNKSETSELDEEISRFFKEESEVKV
ncbi:acetyl-CoA carboxylase, carboxyltransferase subunit beta [bacterium]|nr:acetyl-CoA carboxylase, carboxyltransferase subunit beta [bacterium]